MFHASLAQISQRSAIKTQSPNATATIRANKIIGNVTEDAIGIN